MCVSGFWLPVLRSAAACAPLLAAAADADAADADAADAAGRTAPAAGGMRSGSRRSDAADEKGGLCRRIQGATDPTAPEHLEKETGKHGQRAP